MYSAQLLDHFQNPRNAGALEPPAVSVEVENPACGDLMRLWVRFEAGRAEAVRYQTRGCTASVAAGSALTELMEGRTVAEIERIDKQAIDDALGGLPATSRHAAALCLDAVAALLRTVAGSESAQLPK
jgi:NifU-like protein involved in Fe-S cluster formation